MASRLKEPVFHDINPSGNVRSFVVDEIMKIDFIFDNPYGMRHAASSRVHLAGPDRCAIIGGLNLAISRSDPREYLGHSALQLFA
jgi:hypothetical protein